MLIGIPVVLTPDLLRHLSAMGHGNELIIVDVNFPAEACADRVERLAGVTASEALTAILSVLPLDSYDDAPARTMQVVDDPDEIPDTRVEFQRIIDKRADNPAIIQAVERFEFYEQAKRAYCIVQTAERRLYGNIILKKGVVAQS